MLPATLLTDLRKLAEAPPAVAYRGLKALGAGLGAAGLAATGLTVAHPALRAQASFEINSRRNPSTDLKTQQNLPQQALDEAKHVADALLAQGLDPTTARIAIVGTGGTGKSTLATALAATLGMLPRNLDSAPQHSTGRNLRQYINDYPIEPGSVAEQTNLLTQIDPDMFDAIIHVQKPMDQVRQQILKRGRAAGQLATYDYPRIGKAIETAFMETAGDAYSVGSSVRFKMRPTDGFHSADMLRRAASAHGVDPSAVTDRERLVYAAAHGRIPLTTGVLPYLNLSNIGIGAGVIGGAGFGTGLGVYRALSRRG